MQASFSVEYYRHGRMVGLDHYQQLDTARRAASRYVNGRAEVHALGPDGTALLLEVHVLGRLLLRHQSMRKNAK